MREAHATDGWQVGVNVTDDILIRKHQSNEEREGVAQTCSLGLGISMPVLVEDMDDATDAAYGASPDRLYLVGLDGTVAYKGGPGPWFLDADEWEHAIETYLEGQAAN